MNMRTKYLVFFVCLLNSFAIESSEHIDYVNVVLVMPLIDLTHHLYWLK